MEKTKKTLKDLVVPKKQTEKVGVAWIKKFKSNKDGLKLSINGQLYVAFVNNKKQTNLDPDYIIVKYID